MDPVKEELIAGAELCNNGTGNSEAVGTNSPGWHELPFELLAEVLSQLTGQDIAAARQVCKAWCDASHRCVHVLSPQRAIQPDCLRTLLHRFPCISSLDISRCWGVQMEGLEALRELKGLATLDISSALPGNEVGYIQQLASLTGLTKLTLGFQNDKLLAPHLLLHLSTLTNLRHLDLAASHLGWPSRFAFFPPGLATSLPHLTHLSLAHCKFLASLPGSFPALASLESLSLAECRSLQALPESFGALPALRELLLDGCAELASLPESFGQLRCLELLSMRRCGRIEALPDSFCQLTSLRHFKLSRCPIRALPPGFGALSSLKSLSISCCNELTSLPESFGRLKRLALLSLVGCSALESLPSSFWELPESTALEVVECRHLPSHAGLLRSYREVAQAAAVA